MNYDEMIDKEIKEHGEFAIVFANKLKSNPEVTKLLTGLSFAAFAHALLVECELDLDFITTSQLYDQFKE